MRTLYWDIFAGISGDMSLGSLIALGADPAHIRSTLHSIGLTDFELVVEKRQVHGIAATDVDVKITADQLSHRHLGAIEKMLAGGQLSDLTRSRTLQIFQTLARAEARVHGTSPDQVHFHEVGAVDAIVDIAGTAIALEQLEIEQIYVPEIPWSHGFVQCAHGTLPLPAPATVELLQGFRWRESHITGELVTPTGAAIISSLAKQTVFPAMTVQRVGYGMGKKYYGIPNLLRGIIGEID